MSYTQYGFYRDKPLAYMVEQLADREVSLRGVQVLQLVAHPLQEVFLGEVHWQH